MEDYRLIYPLFAMFLLTLSTLARLFRARSKLVAQGEIEMSFFRTYQGGSEPDDSAKIARHFVNLYEAPVLFYTVCLAALATGITGTPFLVLAWVYVGLRTIHTIIHTGANKLMPRVYAYFSSWIALTALWLLLVYRVISVA